MPNKQQLTNEILDLINDSNNLTFSDIQGILMVILNKYEISIKQ